MIIVELLVTGRALGESDLSSPSAHDGWANNFDATCLAPSSPAPSCRQPQHCQRPMKHCFQWPNKRLVIEWIPPGRSLEGFSRLSRSQASSLYSIASLAANRVGSNHPIRSGPIQAAPSRSDQSRAEPQVGPGERSSRAPIVARDWRQRESAALVCRPICDHASAVHVLAGRSGRARNKMGAGTSTKMVSEIVVVAVPFEHNILQSN